MALNVNGTAITAVNVNGQPIDKVTVTKNGTTVTVWEKTKSYRAKISTRITTLGMSYATEISLDWVDFPNNDDGVLYINASNDEINTNLDLPSNVPGVVSVGAGYGSSTMTIKYRVNNGAEKQTTMNSPEPGQPKVEKIITVSL